MATKLTQLDRKLLVLENMEDILYKMYISLIESHKDYIGSNNTSLCEQIGIALGAMEQIRQDFDGLEEEVTTSNWY